MMTSTQLEQPGWRLRMVTASFKDIEFLTDSHDAKGGRRLVVSEFPGSDTPVVEDLGSKAGEFHLAAYFIGADYDLARDKFLQALNTAGAAWLNHPWRGWLWVRAHNWSVHEGNDKGGLCTIGIDFVPGGSAVAIATADRVDIAAGAITHWEQIQELITEPMTATSAQVFATACRAALSDLRVAISFATLPLTMVSQLHNVIDGIKNDADTLLALPAQYTNALRSLAGLLGSNSTASGLSDIAIPGVVSQLISTTSTPVFAANGAGDSPALRINLIRESEVRSRLILGAAAQVALSDYRVAGDRDLALATVVGAIDRMLPSMSDVLFNAALDMRATLIDALLAQGLKPAQVRDVVSPIPSTVLAHRMGVAEDVFLAVNKVRHPLFVRGRVYG